MNKLSIYIIIAVVLVGILVSVVAYQKGTEKVIEEIPQGALTVTKNTYNSTISASSTSFIVTSTVREILSSNFFRQFAQATNNFGANAYCQKSATSTNITTSTAPTVLIGGSVIFDPNDPYTGALWCLTDTGDSTTFSVEEK